VPPDKLTFLFLDECMYEPLDLASLTGVLVPLQVYCRVRDEMYRIACQTCLTADPSIVPPLVELHGRQLLPALPGPVGDPTRLQVLNGVVDLVNSCNLAVIRVAYLNRRDIASVLKGDPKLYGLNFLGLQFGLDEYMKDVLLVPVMDGIPSSAKKPMVDPSLVRAFALTVREIHHLRQCPRAQGLVSLKHADNLAEPLFGDSASASLLQLADLVSHLLLQVDRAELEPDNPRSAYGDAVVQCGRSLRPSLLKLWRGHMRMEKASA
jgi:hypothetical protein